jgi:hypothetical protein
MDVGRPTAVLLPEFDLREQSLDLLFGFGDWIQRGCQDTGDIDRLRVSKDQREYLLRAFDSLLPGAEDDYQIELTNNAPSKHPRVSLTPKAKKKVRDFLIRESAPPIAEPEQVSLVGELIKIHVDVGPAIIAIRQKGRDIDCFYSDAMRDQIANLMAGSMVEVTGEATLDSQGNVLKLDRLYDVSTVSMDPLRITRFEHAGELYPQRRPLVVDVQYTDDLWVYHCPEINLWGYGERREDALRDLHENFAYLWREFAEEDDAALDTKAIRVKKVLLETTDKRSTGV